MKYDAEWMLAVLDDLQEFCRENQMLGAQAALRHAKEVVLVEIKAQKASQGNPCVT